MKIHLTLCFFAITVTLSAQHISLNLGLPPERPSMVGKNFISTPINERDFALSPDGKEIYFTISTPRSSFQTIVFCRKEKDGSWTAPEVAPFAGFFSDLEPAFSSDGSTLYFASNRPVSGETPKDFDIWKVTRVGPGWSSPENLGTTINTKADEFYPSITTRGNLYFTAAYEGGVGKEDIYVSHFKDGSFQKPMAIDTAINTRFYEFNAFVAPDESYILFTSYGRKDDTGGGDLYISIKDGTGKWQAARNLKLLNSRQLDYCPFVSADGSSLFFTSERHQLPVSFFEDRATVKMIQDAFHNPANGTGNIYWIDFKKLLNSLD